MDQLQNNMLLDLVGQMARQNAVNSMVKSVTDATQSNTGSFRKELEQQSQAANQSETKQAQDDPKAEVTEEKPQTPEAETESLEQDLKAAQELAQQMIAAGVIHISPVEENVDSVETENVVAVELVESVAEAPVVQTMQSGTDAGFETMSEQTENGEATVEQAFVVDTAENTVEATANTEVKAEERTVEQAPAQVEVKGDDTQTDEVEVLDASESAKPLFEQVDTVPVKVGETAAAQKPVETKNVEDQVSDKLVQALEMGQSKVEIRLTPENLGSVSVEITRSEDGSLHILLSAENRSTGALLEKSSVGLESLLMSNGQEKVQVEVQQPQEGQQQNFYDGHNDQKQEDQPQQQRQTPAEEQDTQDFMQQLRLGLITAES